jgi:hypothetical protein
VVVMYDEDDHEVELEIGDHVLYKFKDENKIVREGTILEVSPNHGFIKFRHRSLEWMDVFEIVILDIIKPKKSFLKRVILYVKSGIIGGVKNGA